MGILRLCDVKCGVVGTGRNWMPGLLAGKRKTERHGQTDRQTDG